MDDITDKVWIQYWSWSKATRARNISTQHGDSASIDEVGTYYRVLYIIMIPNPTVAAHVKGIITGCSEISLTVPRLSQLDEGTSSVSLSHTGLSSLSVCLADCWRVGLGRSLRARAKPRAESSKMVRRVYA